MATSARGIASPTTPSTRARTKTNGFGRYESGSRRSVMPSLSPSESGGRWRRERRPEVLTVVNQARNPSGVHPTHEQEILDFEAECDEQTTSGENVSATKCPPTPGLGGSSANPRGFRCQRITRVPFRRQHTDHLSVRRIVA